MYRFLFNLPPCNGVDINIYICINPCVLFIAIDQGLCDSYLLCTTLLIAMQKINFVFQTKRCVGVNSTSAWKGFLSFSRFVLENRYWLFESPVGYQTMEKGNQRSRWVLLRYWKASWCNVSWKMWGNKAHTNIHLYVLTARTSDN